jgi:hypothetical protein
MEDEKMQVIYKYKIFTEDSLIRNQGIASVDMPKKAKILCVQMQDSQPYIWAIVDPEEKTEVRKIRIIGTGWKMEKIEGEYLDTVQQGPLVWHIFDQTEIS